MVSSAIWKKHARTSEFFKDDQNRTGPRASAIEDLKKLTNVCF